MILLQYDSKIAARYRLARVIETFPDAHGRVRTVKVAIRDRRGTAREARNKCNTRKDMMKVGVQRIVTLLPIEEQGPPAGTVATESHSSNPQVGNL